MATIPKDTYEEDGGVYRLVSYREAEGRLLRCEYVDRSRCYTGGEWIVVDVFKDGEWVRLAERGTVPTDQGHGVRGRSFERWEATTAMDEVLDEAEQILAFS